MTMIASVLAAVGLTGGGMAKITSDSTSYDRREGYAYYSGHVFVDDAKYKLHADRAFVFMKGTNELRRIVAFGNVALTNESRCASGARALYYRDSGLVVLSAGEGVPAEVRSAASEGDPVVRGRKIKFWIGSGQAEVVEAEAPEPPAGGRKTVNGINGR